MPGTCHHHCHRHHLPRGASGFRAEVEDPLGGLERFPKKLNWLQPMNGVGCFFAMSCGSSVPGPLPWGPLSPTLS